MMKLSSRLTALATLGLITACGFEPVHKPGIDSGASNIQIEQIDGRTGHSLRKALLRETAAGIPDSDGAVIQIELKEQLSRIGFGSDGIATRSAITLTGRYIIAFSDDAFTGEVRAVEYFSVPATPFGDISAQNDAADRAASVLARHIKDDIILQLSRR